MSNENTDLIKFEELNAVEIVKAIAQGKIANVTINY